MDDREDTVRLHAEILAGKSDEYKDRYWQLTSEAEEPLAREIAARVDKEFTEGKDAKLMADYKKELAQIRQGDIRAIARLKKKYRAKGLERW